MNIKLTLGERLKDLRVERNLKLEALAEQTGLSKSALSKYESDDVTDLSIYAVTTLAEFYDVTTDCLMKNINRARRREPYHYVAEGETYIASILSILQHGQSIPVRVLQMVYRMLLPYGPTSGDTKR